MPTIHSEAQFESDICKHLAANGWAYSPDDTGYDKRLGLFPEDALAWVKSTQLEAWNKFAKNHAQKPEAVFLQRLVQELDRERPTLKREVPQLWGTLYVLRKGFKDINATFRMVQFESSNRQNATTLAHYQQNRLRVMRQVRYSLHNGNSIDLVLFVNGLPVATVELKTDTTQNIEDAVTQYKYDRSPVDLETRHPEPLLSFGKRALVHFAVSCDEVRMATKLAGAATRFLPFNRGAPDGLGGAGAGNAADALRGYATAYLWNDVWQRDAWLGVLGKFISLQVNESKSSEGKMVFNPSILFPRFHQWHAVNALLDGTLRDGVGQSYLVQHSAGSGKSNTIGWLAHRLASLHDAQDKKCFDSVVVITDRRVLDQQLQDTIYQFDHQQGVVEKIDEDSNQLAVALENGKLIIITTLQKFPHILTKVGELGSRRFALILDEAHSSQSGSAAVKLRQVLSMQEKTPDDAANSASSVQFSDGDAWADSPQRTAEDVIIANMEARQRPSNVSYFAFTATPKPKTVELFGTAGEDGLPAPYHVYSMRQAIEEGFILDVLKGYTTYDFAFKLEQSSEQSDKELKSGRAKKQLFKYAQLHPTSIGQKVVVMVEHFREHVQHLVNRGAKAMVVTDSRLAAVRYKKAFDAYVLKQGYTDCAALVAYSGEVTDAEFGFQGLSEGDLNANKERDDSIKTAFAGEDYQVLIVANKYQTGFDQPRLLAMYVDKRLDGVMAVQTLSRLNRTYPGKELTLIIDFRNDPKDILEAFLPFYRTAKLSDVTDRNLVHQLRDKLDAAGVYQWGEVLAFAAAYFDPSIKGKLAGAIQVPLKQAAQRYAALNKESQELFKADMSSFVSAYDFLSQLVSYDDADLEKLHAYSKMLAPRLAGQGEPPVVVEGAVRLAGYKLVNRQQHDLSLEKGDVIELKPMQSGGGAAWDDPLDKLSIIIAKMNVVFAGNISDADLTGYATTLIGKLVSDNTLKEQARANDTVKAFSNGAYNKKLNEAVVGALDSHNMMAEQALTNEEIFKELAQVLVEEVYERLRVAA